MGFLDLKREIFGLDINDLSLKIVKLKKHGTGFSLVSYNEMKIPPEVVQDGVIKKEEYLARIIKSACSTIKGKKLKTKYVVASLPEEKSFLQVIQMPKMSEDELKLAVPLEAENYIPMPISDVYLDFQVMSPAKDYLNNLEVLIVAMPKKIVDSYTSCFKKAGLVPLVLEPESEAVARALIKKGSNSSLMILIDLGENSTNLVVFSGQSIRFTCCIPISAHFLTETISDSLNISFPEAERLKIEYGLIGRKNSLKSEQVSKAIVPVLDDLVLRIKKYLSFYRDHSSYEYMLADGKTEKILLCGGGAELKGLVKFLSKKLEIPVELADPFTNFSVKNSKSIITKNQISFTTAIGLALRKTDD